MLYVVVAILSAIIGGIVGAATVIILKHPESLIADFESRQRASIEKRLRKAGIPLSVPDPKDPTRRLPPLNYSKDRMDRLP